MDEKQLQALANELAKNLKTPEDLSQFDRLLKKISVEAALKAEMSHHLGYDKNQPKPGANSRNGYSTKTVITGDGPLELRTPRDRDGSFEPQLVSGLFMKLLLLALMRHSRAQTLSLTRPYWPSSSCRFSERRADLFFIILHSSQFQGKLYSYRFYVAY